VSKPSSQPVPSIDIDPRVRFAAERTLLAWVRTGVSMMGFGFVVARFGLFLRELALQERSPVSPQRWSLVIGLGLIGLGVVVNILSGLEHAKFLARFDRGEPYRPPSWSLGVVVAVLIAGMGVAMAWYLVSSSIGGP
jgi:putative membrane protein